MVKLLTIYLGFLLIKAVLTMLPALIRNTMFHVIPRRKYTAKEVVRCKHMRPDLYRQKQLKFNEAISLCSKLRRYRLKAKEIITLESTTTNVYKEIDVNVIREKFKKKMQNKQLTRAQILTIRHYLESIVDCKEKKFTNDCHCIYYCLKQLATSRVAQQMLDVTALENFLN